MAVSLGVAGFALGSLLGVLVSGWWRPPRKPSLPAEAPSTTTEFTAHERVDDARGTPGARACGRAGRPPAASAAARRRRARLVQDQAGVRRYWDGERWTEIVWRERPSGRAGKR